MLRFMWALTALCAALGGAGYWNYQRNAPLDEALKPEKRPYAKLSAADLSALEQAYRDELAGYVRQVDQHARSGGGGGATGFGDLQGNIDEFGRAQAGAGRMRQAQLAQREQEVVLEQIARERELRAAGLDDPWNRFKRRLLTF
jgi:hypothetical protein